MRLRSLRVRLPLLATIVLAVSLAVSAVVAFQLLQFVRFSDLDATLRREQLRFQQNVTSIARQLADTADGNGQVTPDLVETAVEEYLRLNPTVTTDPYMTAVTIPPGEGGRILTSGDGPPILKALREGEGLPTGDDGFQTMSTTQGDVRSLSAPILLAGQPVGRFQVMAPLEPIRQESLNALAPMALAAVISLLVGGGLVTIALYRGLGPLQLLARTARTLDPRALGTRVPEPPRQDEVGVLAREFNHMLERLEQESESRRGFLAAASHELRTPITIARGHVELLERQAINDPVATRQTAGVVREELQRIGRLVDDLLAVARSEGEDFVVARAVDLPRFFEDLRLRLTGLGVDGVELRPPPEGGVLADPNRLAQALLNLVVNASVHTPDGTRIELGARRVPGAVALFVRDDGPGIEPEIRERIFDPFVKGQLGRHDSSGLGLAVVAAIVRAHHGQVELDTGPAGTTITLIIPDATSAPDDETKPYAT